MQDQRRGYEGAVLKGMAAGLAQGVLFALSLGLLFFYFKEPIVSWLETIFGPLPRP